MDRESGVAGEVSAVLWEKALELFGGETEAASRWLEAPLPILSGRTPAGYASEFGDGFVIDLVVRLEHGVFS